MPNEQQQEDPSLAQLRERFAAGDVDGARSALLHLSPEGTRQLQARIGSRPVERMMRASRAVRGPTIGRVVVIHGIMGGKLATIDASGDEDGVWLNYWRLLWGRIGRFALDQNAQPADPNFTVVTRGLLDEYMPLVFELKQRWDVLPVAFDWRLNIDLAAAVLDAEIRRWSGGEPVHIVAHSMGGLVARRFIQRFPATWDAMNDQEQQFKRGGRLIMLGTPNRGSFAIPLVLTGNEKTVRQLETWDQKHDMPQLLNIINTFPGSYQMLPSPLVAVNDDRSKLFDSATWGEYPVPQAYLDLGRRFQTELDTVKDPGRLVYVAGYDQPTPYRIRFDGPGRFSYLETMDGDGRVPHELGLLPQVPAYYVQEAHGNLPTNEHVMAALDDLMLVGDTKQLPNVKPASRALPAAARWKTAEEIVPVEAPIPEMRSARAAVAVTAQRAAEIESAMASIFVGVRQPDYAPAAEVLAVTGRKSKGVKPKRTRPSIELEVMWADIKQVDGEVVAAGHYEGVEPQDAERELDKAISGVDGKTAPTPDELVITSQTRRGILRGAVGDINFFPWWEQKKTVAIAGMGRPGTFGSQSLRRTTRSLAESVGTLRSVRTVNTLLIGSGNGNLDVPTAVGAMLEGLADAMQSGLPNSSVRRIRIVERNLRKAQLIFDAVSQVKDRVPAGLHLVEKLAQGPAGRIERELAMSAIVLATAWRVRGNGAAARKAAREVLQGVAASPALRSACDSMLKTLGEDPPRDLLVQAGKLDLVRRSSDDASDRPTRISFMRDAAGVRVAAIGESAVVSERMRPLDWGLVDEIVGRMTDPQDSAMMQDMSGLMARLFVPREFRDRLGSGDRIIVEVDRDTARVQWEMMENFLDSSKRPLGLDHPVARQLRTTYSPAPPLPALASSQLRALVIGDPGDPDKKLALEGARREALEVTKLLRSRGVMVDLLIGAPNVKREGELLGTEPARIIDVLRLLDKNHYDILHYAGHGDFNPEDPQRRAGWIFGDRYFTSRELSGVDRVPGLVVANACLSSLTSTAHLNGNADGSRMRGADDDLLPGLVDEFFMRGVRNYVGTAWPISDTGAILFSQTLYQALLPGDGQAPDTLGGALLKARKALNDHAYTFGALWAAYQHYGDPAFRLRELQ